MSPRALYVAAALAAAAVALAVLGQRQSTPPAGPAGEPVLPGLADALDELTRVTLVAAGGEPVVTLERSRQTWTVAERDDRAADIGRLRAALVALSEASIVERKTADPGRHALIGVEDIALDTAAGTLVRLESASGTRRELILGEPDGAGGRFARRPGQARSFLIDRDPELPRDPAQWLAQRGEDESPAPQ